MRANPAHRAVLESWMRSYRPEDLFDADGRLRPDLARLAPRGERRMSANPRTNGGLLLHDLANSLERLRRDPVAEEAELVDELGREEAFP